MSRCPPVAQLPGLAQRETPRSVQALSYPRDDAADLAAAQRTVQLTAPILGASGGWRPDGDGFYPEQVVAAAEVTTADLDVHFAVPVSWFPGEVPVETRIAIYAVTDGVTTRVAWYELSTLDVQVSGGQATWVLAVRGHPSQSWQVRVQTQATGALEPATVTLIAWGTQSTPEAAGMLGAVPTWDRAYPARITHQKVWDPATQRWIPMTAGGGGAVVVTLPEVSSVAGSDATSGATFVTAPVVGFDASNNSATPLWLVLSLAGGTPGTGLTGPISLLVPPGETVRAAYPYPLPVGELVWTWSYTPATATEADVLGLVYFQWEALSP